MGTAITAHTIGSDLKCDPDAIFEAQALPNNTSTLSSNFLLGQTVGGVEVKVICNTGGTLTAALVIDLQTAATTSYATILSQTVPLGAIVAGQELAKFVVPREEVDKLNTKIKLTTTADESAMKVDAYMVALTR